MANPLAEGTVVEPLLERIATDPGGFWTLFRARSRGAARRLVLFTQPVDGRALAWPDALRGVEHPGLARLVANESVAGRDAFVLEDPGGASLAELRGGPQPAHALLSLATGMAGALEELHAAGAVHGRLELESFVLDPTGTEAVLVELASVARPLAAPDPWTGLRAPEQAGGLPDARSDLYTLGAILYELCVGRPAFDASDWLEQRHLAMAARPVPPHTRHPAVPEGLSAIVMRLLATDPSDRYLSAAALRLDLLHARQLFEAFRDIPSFPLSQPDGAQRFRPPDEPVGRDPERAELHEALAQAAAGACLRVEVIGAAGIGKSTLIETLRAPTGARGGCFGFGRIDPLRAPRPLGALAGALDEIAAQLLSGDAARLERVRRAVARAVEGNGALIAALGHRLVWLLPDAAAAAPRDEGVAAAAARLPDTVERFIRALTQASPPLVLAFDDLHRADIESERLLRALTTSPDVSNLLVVGGVRPGELPDGALAEAPCDLRIYLGGLAAPAIAEVVTASVGALGGAIGPFVRLVELRTHGNPLFIHSYLRHLLAVGALRPSDGGGATVDLDGAAAVGVGGGVAAILVQQFDALPAPVREVLALGARVGASFPAALLAQALERAVGDVESLLAVAEDAGVVARVPTPTEQDGAWRFLHDRLHEGALALLGVEAATAAHARIGRLLGAALGPTPDADALLRAVHQKSLGAAALTTEEDRVELVRWQLRAARVARATGAFDAALALVDAALPLLGPDPWLRPDLSAALYLEAARAALVAAPERVNGLIDALVERASDPLSVAEALELRVDHELARDDANAALAATHRALERLGHPLPERANQGHVALALLRAGLVLRGRSPDALLALPAIEDARTVVILRVLLRASTAAYLTDPNLFIYICCEMVRVGVPAGACPGTAWGLLVFGGVTSNTLNDAAGGYRLGAAALRMLERFAPHGLGARSLSVWYAMQHHTHHSLRESLQPLEEAVRRGLEEGDSLHAGINAAIYLNHLLFSGERLERVVRDVRRVGGDMVRRRQELSIETSAPFQQLALCLSGALEADILLDAPAPTGRPFQVFAQNFCRCFLTVLFGRDAEALAHAERADPVRAAVAGTVNDPLFLFFSAVAAGRSLCFGGDRSRASRRRLQVGLAAMRRRARLNPVDYASRAALLQGLDERLRGRSAAAVASLDLAVRSARARSAHHEVALALHTSALLHEALGAEETARLLWGAVAEAWRAWDAPALAMHAAARLAPLEARPPEVLRVDPDAEVIYRAIQVLASEVGTDALLASLVRLAAMQAGAERVVLLGVRGEELRVRAVHDHGAVAFTAGVPLAEYERACVAAVRLAQRTGEVVFEPDANRPQAFGHDPWVRVAGVRSVLALPVFLRGTLTSILLLEHTHRAGAFSLSDAGPLGVLASVATALLENAELLSILGVRAAELRAANGALQAHSRLLESAVRARTAELDALTRVQASVLDALSEGVCGIGADGRVSFANAAAASLLALPVQDLVGAKFHAVFHAADGDGDGPCLLCEAPAARQDVPARLRGADGKLRWVECAVQMDGEPVSDGRVLSFRDVGRRRELEAQVRHGQKMEAIGLFVGGVAHEFNNLLTPILGRVEMAREFLGPSHPLQESLGSLERAGERAAELVKRLLALGRRTEMSAKPTDLAATIAEALRFLRPTLDRRIALAYSPAGAAWALADQGQVHQILLNLCLNARDALLGAPGPAMRIDIAVRTIEVDAATAGHDPAARSGAWVELEVADTGPGMPPEVLSRVFEPFFTTKKVGEGSGLGLAVLHGIVQQHGGWVSVRSAPGQGTRFRCTFPAAAPVPGADERAPTRPGRVRLGTRVLLVDDEQMVRGVTRSALERHGYDVDEATDGVAALDLLQGDYRPDAIVLDLMMPGLDGWRTLARIREIDPGLPVIVMSGYDTHAGETRSVEPDAELSKPFHLRDLIATVARAIAARAAR